MVPGASPVILLEKSPVPAASAVVLLAVVGIGVVLQHTPLAVTAAPPSEVMFPPDRAEDVVIPAGALVIKTGKVGVTDSPWIQRTLNPIVLG